MTVFHSFVAAATRVTHIPLDWMIFLLHLISIFLFLLGCLALIRKCIAERKLRSGREWRSLQRC